MYVCLCNALTECQVRQAAADGARRPRDVYCACGCRAQCGTCVRAVLATIRDTAAGALAAGQSTETAPAS